MSRHRRSLRRTVTPIAIAAALLAGAAPAVVADSAGTDERLRISDLRVVGGDSWRPENEFRLTWQPPPPTLFVKVEAVNYLIHDATGRAVAPKTRIERTANELRQLQIPFAPGQYRAAPGEYTVEVWLEGNVGEGPHASTVLRFDDASPAPARPLSPAPWIRAGAAAVLKIEHPATPHPASGIRGYAVLLDHGTGGQPCAGPDRCTEAETDLRSGVDGDSISLGPLAEGINVARVVAVSGSGMRSAMESVALHIDGTLPEVALEGASAGWANRPVRLTATATDAQSGMVPTGPAGPFTAIAVDGGVPTVAAGDSVTTTLRGDGTHQVSFYARDAVGNLGDGEAASAQPRFAVVRIDEAAPRVAFAASQDPSEPERIEATIRDPLSGPGASRGSISIRPTGATGPFEQIPTTVSDGKLTAVWDSDAYPTGSYEFRATGYDLAGNPGSTAGRANGTRMVLANPLKRPTSIALGFGGKQLVWHRCGRVRGELRCHREVIGPFERRPASRSIPYGRGVPVAGKLISATGSPLPQQSIELIETFAAGASASRRTTTLQTNSDGTFLARLAPGPSRSVQVSFAGSRVLTHADSRSLRLGVRAAVRLRTSAASAAIGGAPVVFSGQVSHAEAAIPRDGRPVQLEFRLRGAPWSEFRTVQTDAHGRFRYAYSFSDDDSRGVRFEFRASAPSQPGWPYEPAFSRPIPVTGR